MEEETAVRVLTIVLAMSLCLSGGLGPRPVRAERMNPITAIEMTAEKYEYKPAEIRVKAGARVQLKVRALDRDHGLKFKLYPEGEDEEGPVGLRFDKAARDVVRESPRQPT